MMRTLKILFAFSCCVLGYVLCFNPESITSTDFDLLNNILSTFGFLLMMFAGMYAMLKLAKPFVYHLEKVNNFPGRR
jgi:hypothetical protein